MTRPEPTLRVVTPAAEAPTDGVARLTEERARLAKVAVEELLAATTRAASIASLIAEGGDAYPPGVRAACRDLTRQNEAGADTIMAVMGRGK